MATERPLDPSTIGTWLATFEQRDPFCDDAVRHLQSLISDTSCYVVVTLGIGREPRSLVFRRWKHVARAASNISLREASNISLREAAHLDYGLFEMFVGPVAPMAGTDNQFWHQTGTGSRAEKVFHWNGADWTFYGYVRDDPIISKQGKQECGFMEALACAHELAGWNARMNPRIKIIYTFDGSTWGNA